VLSSFATYNPNFGEHGTNFATWAFSQARGGITAGNLADEGDVGAISLNRDDFVAWWYSAAPPPWGRQTHDIVLWLQEFHVREFHLDLIIRQDISHIHLKNVGPLLLQQRGGLTLFFGRFVCFPGLLPLP